MTEDVQAIFDDTLIGSIATVNEDGSPWVSPVHIVTDGEAVYWFSKETVQHSLNVARDPRVSLTLFSSDLSHGPKGVYLNGSAEKLNEAATAQAKQLVEARIGKIPANFATATAYKLKIGQLNSSKSAGDCWYFYS